jgi:hypothetical protein
MLRMLDTRTPVAILPPRRTRCATIFAQAIGVGRHPRPPPRRRPRAHRIPFEGSAGSLASLSLLKVLYACAIVCLFLLNEHQSWYERAMKGGVRFFGMMP